MRTLERKTSERTALLVLFVVGLAVAGVCIWVRPLPVLPSFESYDRIAWNWVQGRGYMLDSGPGAHPDLFRTPGYPLFLASMYWLFGKTHILVYWVQAIMHAAVGLLVFSLVRRAFSGPAALWAGGVVALYPLTAIYVPTILAEPVSVFMTVLSIWLFCRMQDRPTLLRAVWVGAALGYGTLVRPAMALLSIFLFMGAWVATGDLRRYLKPFCVAHLIILAMMAPWVVRNYRVSGEFIPLSNESPLQFWLGTLNYGPYTDMYWTHPLYFLQDRILVKRTRLMFDRNRKPYPVEVRVRRSERLVPMTLHYQVNGRGAYRKVPMSELSPGRFRADVPPQPWGSAVRYFVTARDPWNQGGRIRIPSRTEGGTLYYRVVRNVLGDLGDEVVDLNFLSRQAAVLLGKLPVGPGGGRALDLDEDGRVDRMDLRRAFSLIGGDRLGASFRVGQVNGSDLSIILSDGGRLDLPYADPEGSVYSRLLWRRPSPKAVNLFGAAERREVRLGSVVWRKPTQERLHGCLRKPMSLDEVPCLWKIGMEPSAHELMRFRGHRFFFKENFKHLPMEYLGASLLRVFRVWVIVGTSQVEGQTYVASGAGWLYPALTVITVTLLLLAGGGFYTVRRTWRTHWFLAAPVIYVSLIHAPFHPEARYSLPGRPFLLIYCALALLTLWRRWKEKT